MAAVCHFELLKLKFITVNRNIRHHCAKFCVAQSIRCSDIMIFQFSRWWPYVNTLLPANQGLCGAPAPRWRNCSQTLLLAAMNLLFYFSNSGCTHSLLPSTANVEMQTLTELTAVVLLHVDVYCSELAVNVNS